MPPEAGSLLEARGLTVDFTARRAVHRAVDGVDLQIGPGETVGLVGESGSGKSTTARAILGLLPLSAGEISFDGRPLERLRSGRHQPVADIQVVFQDPYSSLDPTKTVGYSIAEPLRARAAATGNPLSRAEARRQVAEMLSRVGLPAGAIDQHPARYSGGQRQRIAIARALIVKPRLVVLDEAVSALDLSMQAQILNLLMRLQQEEGLSYLFISHDLRVVAHMCSRVVVLYRGRVVEQGPTAEVYANPQHPYTRALTEAAPAHDPAIQRDRRIHRAQARRAGRPEPLGENCPFTHRCPYAIARCHEVRPQLQDAGAGSSAACLRLGNLVPEPGPEQPRVDEIQEGTRV